MKREEFIELFLLTIIFLATGYGLGYAHRSYIANRHIHDFTKWEPMTTPAYIPTMWTSETMFPRQYRTCNDCGLTESRIVK